MKKICALLGICGLLIFSGCSNDESIVDDQNIDAVNLESTIFAQSSTGMYKGVFTTLDGQTRGVIEVQIPSTTTPTIGFIEDTRPKAVLELTNGKHFVAYANTTIAENQNITDLLFSSNNFKLNFSALANGKYPQVTGVTLEDLPSDVLIAKHTNRAPVTPIPGTFVCIECGTHPVLDNSTTQTFNLLMFTTPDGGSTIDTQVTLGMNVFNATGTQSNCVADGTETTCDLSGSFMAGSAPITWSGIHTFNNEDTAAGNDCSGASGTWTFNSVNFGTLTGTFISDSGCTESTSGGLFISEIADPNNFNGSGQLNARYIEVTNGSNVHLDISDYEIQLFSNANTTAGSTFNIPDNTVLTPGQVYVIATNDEDFNTIYTPVVADIQFGSFNSNGDDTFVIVDAAGSMIDVYGTIGVDQTGTCAEFEDGRAVRIASVNEGSTTFDESQWIIRADSTISGCTDHANEPQNAPDDFNPGTH